MSEKLSKFEILKLFKDNCLEFIDDLIELLPNEESLIAGRILFENHMPIEESLERLCKFLIPCEEMIENKEDKLFMTDDKIFSAVSEDKIIRWRNIWKSKQLEKSDKECIWQWADLFLGLCKMYKE
jgi:hypothetical protein